MYEVIMLVNPMETKRNHSVRHLWCHFIHLWYVVQILGRGPTIGSLRYHLRKHHHHHRKKPFVTYIS